MKEENSEIKISVKDIYSKYKITGETAHYSKKSDIIRNNKTGEYYLWKASKKVYDAKEKVIITKLDFLPDRIRKKLDNFEKNINSSELEKSI